MKSYVFIHKHMKQSFVSSTLNKIVNLFRGKNGGKRPYKMNKITMVINNYSPVHIQNDPPQIATEFMPPPQVSDITMK